MKRSTISILSLAALAVCSTPSRTLGQGQATAVWPLTAVQSASVTGAVSASDQSLAGLQISYGSGVQRSSPIGTAGTWPAEASENSARYMQFSVVPASGFGLTISTVSLLLYTSSGSGLRANVYYSKDSTFAVRTQIGTTLTLGTAVPGAPNVTIVPDLEVNEVERFFVRIYPWYTGATTGKYLIANSVTISGTARSSIVVLTSTALLDQFTQPSPAPSVAQQYTVSGTGLTSSVLITPPQNFEISTDSGSTWMGNSSPVTLAVSNGQVTGQPVIVNVRVASPSAGLSTGVITHASDGAPVTEVAVSGVRLAAEPDRLPSLTFSEVSGSSMRLTFAGGNGGRRIVVLRADSPVNWMPTDGVPLNGVDSNFTTAADQENGNRIVYDGPDTSVIVTGLTSNVHYAVAVFEYNVATGNSQNYLTASGATGAQTTIAVPTISVSRSSLAFGMVLIDQPSSPQNYTVSAAFLAPPSGSISVTAPNGFEISLSSGDGYATSQQIGYAAGTLNAQTLFVRLMPTSVLAYNGMIAHSGGSAPNVTVTVAGTGVTGAVFANAPIGYASLNGGTTGGTGGAVTTVTTLAELQAFASSCENNVTPKVLSIHGTITSPTTTTVTIKHGANVSILGSGSFGELVNVGLVVWDYRNVVIRNMKIHEVFYPNDAITVDACENVWIDHNELYSTIGPGVTVDTYDGLLDIKNGSRYVTASWNHLHHHMKCSLIGHTDNAGQQATDSQMRITYHHNWFSQTDGRNPSIRFGAIHMFNNYFEDLTDYGIAARDGAHAKIENSHYHNVVLPMSTDKFPVSGLPNGYICQSGNLFTGTSGSNVISQTGCEFWDSTVLPYAYTLDPVESVENTVKLLAGTGLITSVIESGDAPFGSGLLQVYPNPFNPSATVTYELADRGPVSVNLFDALGRQVREIVNDEMGPGTFSVRIDGSGLSSGVYFIQLRSRAGVETKRCVLVR